MGIAEATHVILPKKKKTAKKGSQSE
jgi:hypothetical protein